MPLINTVCFFAVPRVWDSFEDAMVGNDNVWRCLVSNRDICSAMMIGSRSSAEVLALKHDSRILGLWSNPLSGS